jgi:hypothetical protein
MLFASVIIPLFVSMVASTLANPLPDLKVSCELEAFASACFNSFEWLGT